MNVTYPFYFKELSDKNETIISLESGYLRVISVGEKNVRFARNLWQNIIEACEECECYKILGISLTTKADGDQEALEHVGIFNELGIDHNFKIAWVEKNPEYQDRTKLFEKAFFEQSLSGKAFQHEEEALDWLLNK